MPRSTRWLSLRLARASSSLIAARSCAVRVLSRAWASASFSCETFFFSPSSLRVASRSASLPSGLLALLREGALLGLDLLDRLDLLAAQVLQRGGLVEVAVGVLGEEEGERGVDAAVAVLGARHRTERAAQLVEVTLAARDLVLELPDLLFELLLALLGPVELLGGLLRLFVERVDLGLDLVLARLPRSGGGALGGEGDDCCGGGAEYGHAGAVRLLGSTVGRHGGELLLPRAAEERNSAAPPPSPRMSDPPHEGLSRP